MYKKIVLLLAIPLFCLSYVASNGNQSLSANDENTKIIFNIDNEHILKTPSFPKTVKNASEIIPEGWQVLDTIQNDFNKDNLLDIVYVVEHQFTIDNELYPRVICIYLNNGNGYSLNLVNENLIRNSNEGGVFGDPYQNITVNGNTFTTHAYGGSGWRWEENYTFEFIKGNWFLLAEEDIFGFGPLETYYSFNDYGEKIGLKKYTELAENKVNPLSMKVKTKLNRQVSLTEFSKDSFYATDRLIIPSVKSCGYNEGITKIKDKSITLDHSNIVYQNTDYIVYKFEEANGNVYLGVYEYSKQHMQIIAKYTHDISNERDLSASQFTINKDNLFFDENIVKWIDVYKSGKVTKQQEVVSVQLVKINFGSMEKTTIFKATSGFYMEYKNLYKPFGYIGLNHEVIGDEIIIEVYRSDCLMYYKMNQNGENLNYLGSIPNN